VSATELSLDRWRRITMLGAAAAVLALGLGLGAYQPPVVKDALARAAIAVYTPNAEAVALKTNQEAQP
jgi:hypothetical protein